ncbi:MAG: hypothetical protein ACRC3H_19600 [Lachnospiraceae bacterium]
MNETILIEEINKRLQEIDERLSVTSRSYKDGHLCGVSLTIPIKGNKKTINALCKSGWEKTSKTKVRTDQDKHERRQYEGYVFHQSMRLNIL